MHGTDSLIHGQVKCIVIKIREDSSKESYVSGCHCSIMVNSRAFRGVVTDTTSIALNSDAITSIFVHLYPSSSSCITYSTVLTTAQQLNFILKPLNRLFCPRLDFMEVTETGTKTIPLKRKDIHNYLENLRGLKYCFICHRRYPTLTWFQ